MIKQLIKDTLLKLDWWAEHTQPMLGEYMRDICTCPCRYIDFAIQSADKALDSGSGGQRFRHATMQVDKFTGVTKPRNSQWVPAQKPWLAHA